jgi:release factor glutamine methyltransferase
MSEGGDLLRRVCARLAAGMALAADKPDETVEATALALWFAAAGQPRTLPRAVPPLPVLSDAQQVRLEELVGRRLSGEPLAYLTGRQDFLGLEFLAAPGALIPRRETELLGREAARLLEALVSHNPAPKVLDLCTGSGNVALALANRCPQAEIWVADLEEAALNVAASNARHHGVTHRLHFVRGDLFSALEGAQAPMFDLITCNPPYLTSRHAQNMPTAIGGSEPVAAFDGGPFGLAITLRLIRETPQYLRQGGWLCFELGAGQGPMLEKRLRGAKTYGDVHASLNAEGVIRALHARLL